MALSSTELEIVAFVVHHFIQYKEPTPQIRLIKKYSDPDMVDKLTSVILKSPDCDKVWPGVLAFELCGDPDALRLARKSFEVVVHALQSLFSDQDVEKIHFTIAELKDRAQTIFGPVEQETIMFGLYFVQEFGGMGIHAGLGGVFPNFTSVVIHRRIGVLKDIPGAWDRLVAGYGLYLDQNYGIAVSHKEAET